MVASRLRCLAGALALLFGYSWLLTPGSLMKLFVPAAHQALEQVVDAHDQGDLPTFMKSGMELLDLRFENSFRGFVVRFETVKLMPNQHGPASLDSWSGWFWHLRSVEGVTRLAWIAFFQFGIVLCLFHLLRPSSNRSTNAAPDTDDFLYIVVQLGVLAVVLTAWGAFVDPFLGACVEWFNYKETWVFMDGGGAWMVIGAIFAVVLVLLYFVVLLLRGLALWVLTIAGVLLVSWWALPIHALLSWFYSSI